MNDLAADVLLVAASNAAIASVLGACAWLLHRHGRHRVAHALCVLALLKLLTPPLVRLPVLPAASAPAPAAWFDADEPAPAALVPTPVGLAADASGRPFGWPAAVLAVAALGSLVLLARAARRSRRFAAIVRASASAPADLAARARRLAERMRVRRCPDVRAVPARISPMLCFVAGRPCILLPQDLLASVPPAQVDTLLAHELAHAGRRDHVVRALELLATTLYWWLPPVWWLRRTLRAAEEHCCDRRVLAALPERGRAYADALLATIDFLAGATRAMPPVACGAGAFDDMKTRLTTIMNPTHDKPLSWTLRLALAGAAALLPIAPTVAQEAGDDKARAELRAAMQELEKMRAELDALRADLRAHHDGADQRDGREERALVERAKEAARRGAASEAHEHLKALDPAKLREHLAEIPALVHEHVQSALARAKAQLGEIDSSELRAQVVRAHEEIERAVQDSVRTALADAAKALQDAGAATREARSTLERVLAQTLDGARAEVLEQVREAARNRTPKHVGAEALQRARPHQDEAEAERERHARAAAEKADREARAAARRARAEAGRAHAEAEDEAARRHREALVERLRREGQAAGDDQQAQQVRELREEVRRLQEQIESLLRERRRTR